MIAACMRDLSPFGVVMIYKGEETQTDTDIYSVGTTATICDWEHRADGLLGITIIGGERFDILSTHTEADGLTRAQIKILVDSTGEEIPEQFFYLQELLDNIIAQAGLAQEPSAGFSQTLYRLIYLLPLDANLKQRLLEIQESNDRAVILHAELIRLGIIQYVKPGSDDPQWGSNS